MHLTDELRGRRCRAIAPRARKQRGMVLLIVLVVLSLMFLAGLGVMRAADTGNVIAGNFSFQQAAMQASDRALTDAVNSLATIVTGGAGNTNIANRYWAQQQTVLDARGVPTAVNWDNVSCTDPGGVAISNCATENDKYRIQYVIERMCSYTAGSEPNMSDINDIRGKCEYEPTTTALSAGSTPVRYRVLIRVRGPRGTEGYFEAMVSGPAST